MSPCLYAEQPWYRDRVQGMSVRDALATHMHAMENLPEHTAQEARMRYLRYRGASRIYTLLADQPWKDADGQSLNLATDAATLAVVEKTLSRISGAAHGLCASEHGFFTNYLYEQACAVLEDVPGNHGFLRQTLKECSGRLHISSDFFDEAFQLHEQVASMQGDRKAAGVYFLLLLTQSIRRVKTILNFCGARTVGSTEEAFLAPILTGTAYFERVFHVQSGAGRGRSKNEKARSEAPGVFGFFLSNLLHASALCDERSGSMDMQRAAEEVLTQGTVQNPLLKRPLKHGPADERAVAMLIGCKFPPRLLANVLERINSDEEYTYLRDIVDQLLRQSRDIRSQGTGLTEAEMWDHASRIRSALGMLQSQLSSALTAATASVVAPLVKYFPQNSPPRAQAENQLYLWSQVDHREILENRFRELPGAHPQLELGLLLPTMNAKRIVTDEHAQNVFLDSYARLMRDPPYASPDIARLCSEKLLSRDAYLLLPLQPCECQPQYRDKTLCELLEEFVARTFPDAWRSIIPALSRHDIGTHAITADFSGAIEPPYERYDLRQQAEQLKRDWGANKFPRAWALLEQELHAYLGAGTTAEQWRMMPHNSASGLYPYLINGLYPELSRRDNIILTSQEYDDMVRRTVGAAPGRAQPRYVPRHGRDGTPLDCDQLLQSILSNIDGRTRCIVLSIVSRYGDVLLGGSKHPAMQLVRCLKKLRKELASRQPDVVVLLDACQAVGRVQLPSLSALDDRTIVLLSGGKMLGVGQFGVAAVPEGLAQQIQRQHGQETKLPPDTLRTTSVLTFFWRLRELRRTFCQCDLLQDSATASASKVSRSHAQPQPPHKRIRSRLQELSSHVLLRAAEHAQSLYGLVKNYPSLQGHTKADALRLIACNVFAPSRHRPENCSGVISLWFPTLPAPYLAEELAQAGILTSGSRLDDSVLRIACSEFQHTENIDDLFRTTAVIHMAYLRNQLGPIAHRGPSPETVERERINDFEHRARGR